MTALAALATLVVYFVYPMLFPFGLVTTANVYLWRRRAALLREEREWAAAPHWEQAWARDLASDRATGVKR